jgi:transposase
LLKALLSWREKDIFSFYIPEGHILRRIEERVDFKMIGRILESKYSGKITPIPRIEPIKLFKLYLVMFIYPIYSERELCRRAHSDMAIRWFWEETWGQTVNVEYKGNYFLHFQGDPNNKTR